MQRRGDVEDSSNDVSDNLNEINPLMLLLLMGDQRLASLVSNRLPTPADRLQDAAIGHDFKQVVALLAAHTELSVNSKHSKTGRTVLHEIASCPHGCENSKDFFKQLVRDFHADVKIRDNEGYTPAELLAHPHQYDEERVRNLSERNCYDSYFVGELNARLDDDEFRRVQFDISAKKQRLELVNNTEEMISYVRAHLEYDQIGFLIKRPNCNKASLVAHLSPILFDRMTNTFVQLDSFGLHYLIPKLAYGGATVIYSPITRQVSNQGCREDAIYLAYYILTKFPTFFAFCHEKSEQSDNILLPLSDYENALAIQLGLIGYNHFSKEQKAQANLLNNKILLEQQRTVFEMEGVKPISDVRCLQEWPVNLVLFMERFDEVKKLRTQNKLGHWDNHKILKSLLQNGVRRNHAASDRVMLANLRVDLPNIEEPETNRVVERQYDIGGVSFQARHNQWNAARNSACQTVHRLFSAKMAALPDDRMDGNKSKAQQGQQKAAIVDKICDFAGLKRFGR